MRVSPVRGIEPQVQALHSVESGVTLVPPVKICQQRMGVTVGGGILSILVCHPSHYGSEAGRLSRIRRTLRIRTSPDSRPMDPGQGNPYPPGYTVRGRLTAVPPTSTRTPTKHHELHAAYYRRIRTRGRTGVRECLRGEGTSFGRLGWCGGRIVEEGGVIGAPG